MIDTINNILKAYIPDCIFINFILFLLAIIVSCFDIKDYFRNMDKRALFILSVIAMIALFLRIFIPPHQHMLYIDEPWYMEAGKNLLLTGEQLSYQKSIGWPFILSAVFGVFDISNWTAINTSVVLGSLTAVNIFLISRMVTGKDSAALLAALIFSFMPIHIRWSASAETNVPSIFFITLSIFFCFLFYEKRKTSFFWLSVIALSFTAQIRPENYAFLILFIAGIFMFAGEWVRGKRMVFLAGVMVFILLSLPNLIQVLQFQTSTSWMKSDSLGAVTGDNWSFANLLYNSLKYNFFVVQEEHRVYFTFCHLFSVMVIGQGLYFLSKEKRKETVFLLMWWAICYLVYFSSWFQTLPRSRFYMSFYPVVIIFYAYSVHKIYKWGHLGTLRRKMILYVVSLVYIILISPNLEIAKKFRSSDARKLETIIPEQAEKDLPADVLILANCPMVLTSTTDLNVISMKQFFQYLPDKKEDLFREYRILAFEDLYTIHHSIKSFRNDFEEIKKQYDMDIFKDYSSGDEKYTFYELKNRS